MFDPYALIRLKVNIWAVILLCSTFPGKRICSHMLIKRVLFQWHLPNSNRGNSHF